MTSAPGHLRELLAYAATRRGHDRADAATAADLAAGADELGLPAGLEVRWIGVAGFVLTCEATTIVIDPYVTRLPLSGVLRRTVAASDPAAVDRWVPRADAVLLGHTHFDHALDAPAVAHRDGATVYGGRSAAHLMGIHGLGAQAVEVTPHRRYEIGPFTVTFVPSQHAKLLLGRSVPNGGEITCEHVGDLSTSAYGCGEVWGIHIEVDGFTLYHQGSADLIDDEVRHRDVDVFLCGVAGRQFTPGYLARILGRLRPHHVVVTHHDDFFKPLGGDLGFAFGVDVARFPDEVAAVSDQPRVVTFPDPVPALARSGPPAD